MEAAQPGRVERRQAELALTAAAYAEGRAELANLCVAALRYAAAVFHNRKSRERGKLRAEQQRTQWAEDEETED